VDCIIPAGKRLPISTGIALTPPEGYFGKLFSRSSLASKGIDVGAGIIDPDYTGEIKVLLINNSEEDF